MRIYTLHGFNVTDEGNGTTDVLKEAFPDAIDLDYTWDGYIGKKICNEGYAKLIARLVEPDSIAIGHSNGCAIIHKATLYGAKFKKVIYINPALDSDLAPNSQVSTFDVYHSPSDHAVWISKFIPFDIWGDMGQVGYTGEDDRGTNFNLEEITGDDEVNHSEVFELHNKEAFLRHIKGRVPT